MKICGKQMPKAKNGKSRGICRRNVHHGGRHGSKTCSDCGAELTIKNASPSVLRQQGLCRNCHTIYLRKFLSRKAQNFQLLGKRHRFRECGCEGILPKQIGKSNQFAKPNGNIFGCRISAILNSSKTKAKKFGYKPVIKNILHSVIRKLMEEPNCECCGGPLKWKFGVGKTPHLHHNHETGVPIGFAHPSCNPRALENEIKRLRLIISQLTKAASVEDTSEHKKGII